MRSLVSLLFLSSTAVLGQATDIPLTNWTVPPYRSSVSSGGLTTMTDVSPGVGFVAVQPCRVVDTRGGGVFIGTYGPPIMAANAQRSFGINSAPHCPGIPAGVDAYSLNFTATQTVGAPGDIRSWPTGNPPVQVTSVLNWTVGNATVANATIIPAGTNGFIDVYVAGTATHLLIDINGYFTDQYNPGVSFHAVSGNVAPAILGENTSTEATAFAIQAVITSTAPGASAAAVRGINNSTTTSGIGVWGSQNGSGSGVLGDVQTGIGVMGRGLGTLAASYGVWGQTSSPEEQAGGAGVFGTAGGLTAAHATFPPGGVIGESQSGGFGVLGITQDGIAGASGYKFDSKGSLVVSGHLGHFENYGVVSIGDGYIGGDLTVQGFITAFMKPFVQPHPFDPSKQIRYVSLEGPHSEVYFRGTVQIAQGITRIAVPEDFRLVADPNSYSTLLTPVGEMATVAVLAEGRDGIVVKASRDVRVHYVVYAEREAMRNPDPVMENVDFRPKPGGDLLRNLPESYRRLMIQNGTLSPDGTVNMETARRLGWDKEWEKRSRPTPQPVSD